MYTLILDTCVWINLALLEFSIVEKLERLLETGKVRFAVPERVLLEWKANRANTEKKIVASMVKAFREVKQHLPLLDEAEPYAWPHEQLSGSDPAKLGGLCAKRRLDAIERLIESEKAVQIPETELARQTAIDHALEKKAPFRMRNGMADALIFFSAIEWANAEKPKNIVFVSNNVGDFCEAKDQNESASGSPRLAPELERLTSSSGMKFGSVIGRVLNEVEGSIVSDEEVARGDEIVKRSALAVNDSAYQPQRRDNGWADLANLLKPNLDLMTSHLASLGENQLRIANSLATGIAFEQLEALKPDLDLMTSHLSSLGENQIRNANALASGAQFELFEAAEKRWKQLGAGELGFLGLNDRYFRRDKG